MGNDRSLRYCNSSIAKEASWLHLLSTQIQVLYVAIAYELHKCTLAAFLMIGLEDHAEAFNPTPPHPTPKFLSKVQVREEAVFATLHLFDSMSCVTHRKSYSTALDKTTNLWNVQISMRGVMMTSTWNLNLCVGWEPKQLLLLLLWHSIWLIIHLSIEREDASQPPPFIDLMRWQKIVDSQG